MAATTENRGDDLAPDGLARDFVNALRRVEDEGDLDDMVDLFDPDAELFRLGHPDAMVGKDGARRFWEGHRAASAQIESRFTHATSTDRRVILEWSAQTRLHDGKSTTVDGVSILELGDENLTGFRTYFDTAAFVVSPTARTEQDGS